MKFNMQNLKHYLQPLMALSILSVSTAIFAATAPQQENLTEQPKPVDEQMTPHSSQTELNATASTVVLANEKPNEPEVKPLTQAEIREGLNRMQKWMVASIDEWGKTLKAEDFERTWTGGRQLTKPKRQEVCGIYQRIVNETYKLAIDNKLRLPQKDQAVLKDRDSFIQSLGYKNNVVDTKMGFNCRIK